MLNLVKILFLLLLTPAFGQDNEEIYSVYFDSKINPGTKKLNSIPAKYYGTFSLITKSEIDLRGAAGDNLIVDESGVYLSKNRLLSISREEIRENSQYSISNGYLHGVLENDSVLVALEDDSYYFLIPRKIYLYELANQNTFLYQGLDANKMLVLSKEDNTHYSAIYVTFNGGNVVLNELDFDQKILDFRSLRGKKTEIEGTTTYILNPTKVEWQLLMKHFITYDTYRTAAKS